jgi:hypothetical protein
MAKSISKGVAILANYDFPIASGMRSGIGLIPVPMPTSMIRDIASVPSNPNTIPFFVKRCSESVDMIRMFYCLNVYKQ